MEEGTDIIILAERDDPLPLDEALLFVGTWWAINDFRVGEYHDDDDINRGLRAVDLFDEEIDGVEENEPLMEVVVVAAAAIAECCWEKGTVLLAA